MRNLFSGLMILTLLLLLAEAVWAQSGAAPAAPESRVEDLPAPAPAQTAAPAAPASGDGDQRLKSPDLSTQITDIAWAFGVFILVLLLLYLTLKGLSRLGRFRGRGRNSIFELRGVLPLDNRKYLAAVAIEGRLLVLGVSSERINHLANWPLDDYEEAALNFSAAPPAQDGPDLAVKSVSPDEDPGPPDISVADLNRSLVK